MRVSLGGGIEIRFVGGMGMSNGNTWGKGLGHTAAALQQQHLRW